MRTLKAIYWHLYIVRLSLRWIPKLNLGNRVRYMGIEWSLIQGVNKPIWTLYDIDTNRTHKVHEDKFRKVWSVKGCWQSFLSGYRFYISNWYSIWMQNGIESWMLNCNIWSGKPPTADAQQDNPNVDL